MILFEQNSNNVKMTTFGRNMYLFFAIKYHHKSTLPQLWFRD